MFDLHYDLLSILYLCYLKKDFTYINEIKNRFNEQNVKSLIANLYFMSKDEMFEECELYGEIDVIEMFKISTSLYNKYFSHIPCIFSIEGCDYVKISDLETLYSLGLRNVLLVWNNANIYGSGPRTDNGITNEGKKFIKKCMELGICIDLSHANIPTFNGISELISNYPLVIASHSNIRSLTDVSRNLNDNQILKLKELNGLLGIVSYKAFLGNGKREANSNDYLEHIKYAVKLLGVGNVCVSSDDMTFDPMYLNDCIFNYESIYDETKKLLLSYFDNITVEKILYRNAYNRLNSLLKKEN